VEIGFINKKQETLCTDWEYLKKKKSEAIANSMKRCMAELEAVESLQDMDNLTKDFEELRGNLAGKFSLRLDRQFRLIFEPATAPIPRDEDGKIDTDNIIVPKKPDGGIDLKQVTAVIIREAVSDHYKKSR
jgi:plasmid maintenance system killer protein